jgi:hypothetical protein
LEILQPQFTRCREFVRICFRTTGCCLESDFGKLIAQAYEGTAVMSGKKGGVQTVIKEIYKNAHFIHCCAHQLNLIMEKAASQNPEVRIL